MPSKERSLIALFVDRSLYRHAGRSGIPATLLHETPSLVTDLLIEVLRRKLQQFVGLTRVKIAEFTNGLQPISAASNIQLPTILTHFKRPLHIG